MTNVRIYRENGHIVRVSCFGHSGYGDEGEDIVCSALSSVVQTAVLGLMRVASINLDYKIDEGEGLLELKLPDGLSDSDRHNADMILETMCLGVADLHEGFSRYIKLEQKKI